MTDVPGSPTARRIAAPTWLDGRLVLGVLLVLVSVLVGAKVLAGADTAQQVWVATHDLAPGTVLGEDDLRTGRVRLFDAGAQYVAGAKPIGYLVVREISSDELLPRLSVTGPEGVSTTREVTVPVPVGHLPPDLDHGDRVDLYVTPSDATARRTTGKGVDPYAPRLVLRAVPVARVVRAGGLGASGQDQTVVLSIAPADVATVVQALADGTLDLVRVPHLSRALPAVSTTTGPRPSPTTAP